MQNQFCSDVEVFGLNYTSENSRMLIYSWTNTLYGQIFCLTEDDQRPGAPYKQCNQLNKQFYFVD